MSNIKYTHEQYTNMIEPRKVVPLDRYINMNTPIDHLCLVCNNVWRTRPGVLRDGKECRHCYKLRIRKPLSIVQQQLKNIGWSFSDSNEYINSYSLIKLTHLCGNCITTTLDRALRKTVRCLECKPRVLRPTWSIPVTENGRTYYSQIERDCCEYLMSIYGSDDIQLHKKYPNNSKKECDAYIKSKNLYIEISTINKPWYLERIYKKQKLVDNFLFVSSLEQLRLYCQ